MSEILSMPQEHKFHIFSPPCNILYIIFCNWNRSKRWKTLRKGWELGICCTGSGSFRPLSPPPPPPSVTICHNENWRQAVSSFCIKVFFFFSHYFCFLQSYYSNLLWDINPAFSAIHRFKKQAFFCYFCGRTWIKKFWSGNGKMWQHEFSLVKNSTPKLP